MVCARNQDDVAHAVDSLRRLAPAGTVVDGAVLDVTDRRACDDVVAHAVAALGRVDVLVNSAGVLGPVGAFDAVDWDAWVDAVTVNLVGSAAMCQAVLPVLRAAGGGAIIQLSGGGATKGQPRRSAYAASKAGIVRFVETLALEVADAGITVNAIAPGAVNTRFLDDLLAAGADHAGPEAWAEAQRQQASGGASPEAAAQLSVLLASDRGRGITGRLISAIWDDWEHLPDHLDELDGSDALMLRRVVPAFVERPS